MTPAQVAEAHCANWDKGACLGVYYNSDLSIRFKRPFERCLLRDCKKCYYFEEIIVPMFDNLTETDKEHPLLKNRLRDFNEGVAQYHVMLSPQTATKVVPTARVCPDCKKRPLEPKRRVCDICRKNRRKTTIEAANRQKKL